MLADVIPPDIGPITDAKALLSFAWQGGFLNRPSPASPAPPSRNTARSARKSAWLNTARRRSSTFSSDAGFEPERAARNLGHNQARMTFVARPAQARDSEDLV